MPDDAILLAQAAAGNEKAFGQIYRRYASDVFGLALRMTGSRETAEDVAQDVFASVWLSAAAFYHGRRSAAGWIMRIARNRAIDELRRRGSRPEQAIGAWEETLPATGMDPAGSSDRADQRQRVRRAVTRLPRTQREMLSLAFFGGWTHADIAALTGAPVGTVKTRIRLAMQKLRRLLADEEEEP